jgi:basic membrane protein A and related proteins
MHTRIKTLATLALTASLLGCSAVPSAPPATSPVATLRAEIPQQAPEQAKAQGPLKIGFVYVGQVGDAGWSYQHDLGRQAVEQAFGPRVQTTYVENVSEISDGQVFRDLAATGHQLIFATAFGYLGQIQLVSPDLPGVKFEHVQGYKRAQNVRTYDVRTYEGAYLAGMLAGGMSRSNKLGVVASIPVPEIVSVINAFTLGAQAVNPKAVTEVEWVMQWFDPPNEATAANKLFKRGVDIAFQTTDSAAVLMAAQRHGRRGIAWDSDMSKFAPRAHLGAVEVNWAPYYQLAVEQALNGTWSTGTSWWGIDRKAVDLTHLADDVPKRLKARIDEARTSIANGSLKIWQGPMKDNRQAPMLSPGEVADDRYIANMNQLVWGVKGTLP